MQNNNSVLNGLIGQSSNFLLAAMVLSFVLMFSVQMFYYSDAFKDIVPNIGFAFAAGIGIGLFTQLVRLSFGLAGAYEFSNGRYGSGATGLLFSFGVTIFESFEVVSIAAKWGASDLLLEESLLILFLFLIWTGFGLEIRLALNISGGKKVEEVVVFSSNGATKKKGISSRS